MNETHSSNNSNPSSHSSFTETLFNIVQVTKIIIGICEIISIFSDDGASDNSDALDIFQGDIFQGDVFQGEGLTFDPQNCDIL